MKIIDYRDTIPSENYSSDIITPLGITLHITDDNDYQQALGWVKNHNSGVSYNYIVEKNGEIDLCVSPNMPAFHNGIVKNPTASIILDRLGKNPNWFMIGISIVAKPYEKLTSEQYISVKQLIRELSSQYNIPINRHNIIGHYEVCPERRPHDPVSVYSINEIINGINYDKKIESLQKQIIMLEHYKYESELYKTKYENKSSRIKWFWEKLRKLKKMRMNSFNFYCNVIILFLVI